MSEAQILAHFEQQFGIVYNDLANQVTQLANTTSSSQALPLIQSGDMAVRRCDQLVKKLDAEKRHMDQQSKAIVERKKKILLAQWEITRKQFNEYKSQHSTAQLSASERAVYRDQRQKLLVARGVGEDNTASLDRTENLIQQSTLVGHDTNVVLERQTEQLKNMNATAQNTNATLDESKNVLVRIRRRVFSNKLASLCIILLELVILILLIFVRFYANGK